LLSNGVIVANYPLNGKVTSLNAYLTGDQQIIADPNGPAGDHVLGNAYKPGSLLVESPDVDGTYGKNDDGIFFFTADTDSYVEWHGDYLFTDSCLRVAQQPLLVRADPATPANTTPATPAK
jgi:hypothetical protein